MLVRVDVDHPPLLVDLDHSSYYDVADIWPVALPKGSYANDLIDLVNYSGHASVDLAILFVLVCAMPRDETFADLITRQDDPHLLLLLFNERLVNIILDFLSQKWALVHHVLIRLLRFLHSFLIKLY